MWQKGQRKEQMPRCQGRLYLGYSQIGEEARNAGGQGVKGRCVGDSMVGGEGCMGLTGLMGPYKDTGFPFG